MGELMKFFLILAASAAAIGNVTIIETRDLSHRHYAWGLTVPQNCHYADPFKQPCKSDELQANITAQPRDLEICVSKCSTDADCPTDTCPGTVSKPACILSDDNGNKFCGLPCTQRGPSAPQTNMWSARRPRALMGSVDTLHKW